MQGKNSPEQSAESQVYAGIDVCKAWLDVYIHAIGQPFRVANDRGGLKKLKRELANHNVQYIAMEATGKHHRQAHRNLHAGGFAVTIVNPLRSRLFAEAIGALAKTDAIDAQVLAVMGESLKLEATKPPTQEMLDLQELFRARQAVVADTVALKNQLGEARIALVKKELKRRIKSAEGCKNRLDAEILKRIKADAALARRFAIVKSIKGVGPVAAMTLVIGMDELGSCTSKQASMLAGLAPVACDSGAKSGERRIRGGRADIRTGIYMSALAASRSNPDLKIFYQRLRDAGKDFKVAVTAVMRKLIVLANTLLHEDRLWEANYAPAKS
jgi:transposase